MKQQRQPDRFFVNGYARGPEVIPRPDTRAWYEYQAGRRFFMSVLPGQRFPEGAGPKELERLANQRLEELTAEAARTAITNTPAAETAEAPEPAIPTRSPEADGPPVEQTLAA